MEVILIIPLLLGWAAGLTVNYLADVLPITRSFSQPACLQCGSSIGWLDYLLFRACANGHPRKMRSWVVQAIMTALSVYIWNSPPVKLGYIIGLFLLIYFGIVFVIDLEHRLILHPTSIAGSILGLVVGWLKWGLKPALIGGLFGLTVMLALYFFGVLFARARAKRMAAQGQEVDDEEALGAGDVILLTILGLMLGWPFIWFGLLFGILLGGFFSLLLVLWLLVSRKYKSNALMLFIPYGPYFIISAFLIIFFPTFLAMILPG